MKRKGSLKYLWIILLILLIFIIWFLAGFLNTFGYREITPYVRYGALIIILILILLIAFHKSKN